MSTVQTLDGSKQVLHGRIAFSSRREGTPKQIYVMNADGSRTIRLTYNDSHENMPAWSPDGTRIAFTSLRDGHHAIYTMASDGSSQIRLTTGWSEYGPAWSPNGKRIAFTSHRDGHHEVYVMDADGSNVIRLTDTLKSSPFYFNRHPAWSPDNQHIALESNVDGGQEIYILDTKSGYQRRLTFLRDVIGHPSWSPDGNSIAFYGQPGIYIVNADGSGFRQLTEGLDSNPAWSPDGHYIAYSSLLEAELDPPDPEWRRHAELFVVSYDGSIQIRLTNGITHSQAPSWVS
jgi:Tol biopolymer transport system component